MKYIENLHCIGIQYSLWAMGIECDAHNVADEPAGTWSENGLNTLQA